MAQFEAQGDERAVIIRCRAVAKLVVHFIVWPCFSFGWGGGCFLDTPYNIYYDMGRKTLYLPLSSLPLLPYLSKKVMTLRKMVSNVIGYLNLILFHDVPMKKIVYKCGQTMHK